MKSLVRTIACMGILASICATTCSVHAQNGPTIPAWIHPGLVVIYGGDSAFVTNGRFSQAVRVVMTTRVNSSSATQVSAASMFQTVGTPLRQQHAWRCNAAGNCSTDSSGIYHQFWVDPANPTASVHGPHGEPYTMRGTAPYTVNGKTWTGTVLVYENAASGVQFVCTFDAKTGLILQYSETSPSQQVHTFFRSMSGQ